ncbi:MAG: hypothetical protein QNI84_09905 [Henriciella sp.]|nr:hypothetical protein [Henriciella sp.]
MKDIVFFPIVLLVAILMVTGAMVSDDERRLCGPVSGGAGPADYSYAIVEGRDLCRMEAGPSVELNRVGGPVDEAYLTLEAIAEDHRDDPEFNSHFKLAADLEYQYAGQKLRLLITARPSGASGAEAFEVNYSTGKAGETGWIRFNLKPGWETYRFDYNVPEKLLADSVAFDYFAIRPVIDGKARSVDIQRIEFRKQGKWGVTGS